MNNVVVMKSKQIPWPTQWNRCVFLTSSRSLTSCHDILSSLFLYWSCQIIYNLPLSSLADGDFTVRMRWVWQAYVRVHYTFKFLDYHIASNHGLDIYFFPEIFLQELNKTGDYTRLTLITWTVLNQSFWVMNSKGIWQRLCSRFARYCAQWNGQHPMVVTMFTDESVVASNRRICNSSWRRSPPDTPHKWWICSCSDKGFSDSGPQLV